MDYNAFSAGGNPYAKVHMAPMDNVVMMPQSRIRKSPASVFRQVWWLWLSLLATIIIFGITALYAGRPTIFSTMGYSATSISSPVRNLRILSGVTDILLAITFNSILERTQWAYVQRSAGLTFAELLALHSSTGPLGLLRLAFGWAVTGAMPRIASQVRLLMMICIAVVGIIIMIDVNSVAEYLPVRTWTLPGGAGVGEFNTSLAFATALQVDRVYGMTEVHTFLRSSELAVDITPEGQRTSACEQQDYSNSGAACERTIFLPGAVPMELTIALDHPEASILTAYDMQGYVLHFGPGEGQEPWQFDEETDCQTLGVEQGAVRLCIRNTATNQLEARMAMCPTGVAFSKCLSDTSWHTNATVRVSTTLTAEFRRADVSYHRANASIASYADLRDAREAPISATELSSAYTAYAQGTGAMLRLYAAWQANTTTSAGITATDNTAADLIDGMLSAVTATTDIPGMNPLFPFMPFTVLDSCSRPEVTGAKLSSYCTVFLQNFLALPLYWDNKYMLIRATMGVGVVDFLNTPQDSTSSQSAQTLDSFMATQGLDTATAQRLLEETPDSEVAIAKLQYLVRVGRTSLLAYCIVTGVVLLVCAVALIWGSSVDADAGSYALWDFVTLLEVENYTGELRDARVRRIQQGRGAGGQFDFQTMQGVPMMGSGFR